MIIREENYKQPIYEDLMSMFTRGIYVIKTNRDKLTVNEARVAFHQFLESCIKEREENVIGFTEEKAKMYEDIVLKMRYIFDMIELPSGSAIYTVIAKAPDMLDYIRLEVVI